MSAGELEHEWAGTPGRLIRERYRKAAEVSRVLGISLLDAAVLSIFAYPCRPAPLLGSCTCKLVVLDIIPLGFILTDSGTTYQMNKGDTKRCRQFLALPSPLPVPLSAI